MVDRYEEEKKDGEGSFLEGLSPNEREFFSILSPDQRKTMEGIIGSRLAAERARPTAGDVPLVVNCLPKSDSNDEAENVNDVVNTLGELFSGVPPFAIQQKDLHRSVIQNDAPTAHKLETTLGVQYRGIPKDQKGQAYWEKREFEIHNQVMSSRILFENTAGIRPKRVLGSDRPKDPLSEHVFLTEHEVQKALGEQKSVIVGLLYKNWPLSRELKYITESPSCSHDLKAFVAPCIQINAKTQKMEIGQNKATKKTCKCGAIFASIAKGKHEGGDNDELKLAQLLPFLHRLEDFRQKLHAIGEKETMQSKELLCYHCRIFVMTYVSGANQNKFVIIGTDQRCSVLNGSQGCQQGLLPLCYNFQRFIFGRWTEWGAMATSSLCQELPEGGFHEEKLFDTFFYGCLRHKKLAPAFSRESKVKLCVWYNGKTGSDGQNKKEKQDVNGGCYKRIRFRNILMNFYARAIIKFMDDSKSSIWEDSPPPMPPAGWTFELWHVAELLPITKSLNMNYSTYYECLACVRDILGMIPTATQHIGGAQRQRASGVQTKIAHHNLTYLWDRYKKVTDSSRTNVLWDIVTGLVYEGFVPESEKEQDEVLKGQKRKPIRLQHATNVTVHELGKVKRLLAAVVEKVIGPIPKRKGQKFGNLDMGQYAPSTHTLFRAISWGTKETSGLELMLSPHVQKDELNLVTDLQTRLVEQTILELHRNDDWKGIDFESKIDAEFYQSRFDTSVRVCPAPHTDLGLDVLSQMQDSGTFIKYYILPAGEEGLWIRLFSGCNDWKGRLIKVEPDTILGFPSTAIREVGYISHIEGNPHFMIRITLRAKKSPGGIDVKKAFRRCYPHIMHSVGVLRKNLKERSVVDEEVDDTGLGKTSLQKASKNGTLPVDWERSLRTLSHQESKYIGKIQGVEQGHLFALKELRTHEVTMFDKHFGI
jgi:hypothetical protein